MFVSLEALSLRRCKFSAMTNLATVLDSIGNTPIVQLQRVVPPGSARVLAKLEWSNPTGSMKDRMAIAAIEGAEAKGLLKPGGTAVEYTAGTTGVSLALVCANVKTWRVRTEMVVNRLKSTKRLNCGDIFSISSSHSAI